MEVKEYKIEQELVGIRLDKAISMKDISISRVAVQRLIDEENILVNGKKTKASYKLNLNDVVSIKKEVESVLLAYVEMRNNYIANKYLLQEHQR